LLPREDLVEAKGKGHMQTFWLECDRGRSTVSSLPTNGTVESTTEVDPNDDKKDSINDKRRRTSIGELYDI
jgi:hypothetical protein